MKKTGTKHKNQPSPAETLCSPWVTNKIVAAASCAVPGLWFPTPAPATALRGISYMVPQEPMVGKPIFKLPAPVWSLRENPGGGVE